MKMMSKGDNILVDYLLETAAYKLECSIKKMKGKYGTSDAVFNLEYALKNIRQCFLNEDYCTRFYQKFRNPPNTPKSRRLGWHEKGANDEQ